MWRLKVFVFCIFLHNSLEFTSETLKVNLDHGGSLTGRHLTTVKGRHIRAFQGIPYAQPPVGELRFKVKLYFLNLFHRFYNEKIKF